MTEAAGPASGQASGQNSGPRERSRLYLVTPERLDPDRFRDSLAAALDAGDVACVQLRLKGVEQADWERAIDRLLPVCQARDVAFLVNDRPDLAASFDADGCHVGQDDSSYEEARAVVGADRIVGVTCHASVHLAIEAAEAGADYVAFGAFFPSATKAPKTRAPVELLEQWSAMSVVPCVAIGGITVDNGRRLVEAGADFLAVVSGVWNHPDGPVAAVRAFNAIFDECAAASA